MGTETTTEYEQAMDLAEAGQYQQALDLVQAHLQDHPDDAEALNDTAVLLHCMNRSGEGIAYLQRAREIAGDTPEIVWNFVESYLAEGETDNALSMLELMKANGTINIDVLNRTAHQLVDENRLEQAEELLNWSLSLYPDQELLRPIVEILRAHQNPVTENGPSLGACSDAPEN